MVWPMAVLRFDRGTLLLEGFSGAPPPPFEFNPRVGAYRAPAISYSRVIWALRGQIRENRAPAYRLGLTPERAEYRIECVYVDLSLAISKRLKVSRDDLGGIPGPIASRGSSSPGWCWRLTRAKLDSGGARQGVTFYLC
ncbi:hypothetical protein Mrose_00239 [Calidithermus roseus]|uniref:DNA 3'-5' translocase XPB damage recognition domain-containing protein n=2 Tax=Calidithermus roseus TaxID=1644118 RepID=A0A399F0Z7_9DEIN|nr:hypothetical protein Mrose_00239 [Calidithermus roseus]